MALLTVHKKLNRCYGKYFSGINIKVSLSSLSVCLSLRNAALLTTNSTNQTDQEKKRFEMDALEIEGLERGDCIDELYENLKTLPRILSRTGIIR